MRKSNQKYENFATEQENACLRFSYCVQEKSLKRLLQNISKMNHVHQCSVGHWIDKNLYERLCRAQQADYNP